MRILLTKKNKMWYADCLDIPGSPYVGIHPKKYKAIALLFIYAIEHNHTHFINLDTLDITHE